MFQNNLHLNQQQAIYDPYTSAPLAYLQYKESLFDLFESLEDYILLNDKSQILWQPQQTSQPYSRFYMNYYSTIENTVCSPLKQSLLVNEMLFRAGLGRYTSLLEGGSYCLHLVINPLSIPQIFTYDNKKFNLTQIKGTKIFILQSLTVSVQKWTVELVYNKCFGYMS